MPPQSVSQIRLTELLGDWSNGDETAADKLFPLVYQELKRIARRHLRNESPGHMLQATALVNEAYLRLADQKRVTWQNRAHFYAIAAQTMRRILIDHARGRVRLKRGGRTPELSLEQADALVVRTADELLALDEALHALAEVDRRRSRVVELRFFGGLKNEEIAEVLKIAPNTVVRDWNLARAWLYHELSGRQAEKNG